MIKVKINLDKDNYLQAIVALTSLCKNYTGHVLVLFQNEGLSGEEIEMLKDALHKYDVEVKPFNGEEDFFKFESNFIIDGSVSEILESEDNSHNKDFLSIAINADAAHDEGIGYDDIKGIHPIIYYSKNGPLSCSNLHYDIEKIWWEYAKQTPIYIKLMEAFLDNALADSTLEDYANSIFEENKKLTKALNEVRSRLKILL